MKQGFETNMLLNSLLAHSDPFSGFSLMFSTGPKAEIGGYVTNAGFQAHKITELQNTLFVVEAGILDFGRTDK